MTYHPNVVPPNSNNSMWAFLDASNNTALSTIASLDSKSPCLANIARKCTNNFFGYHGYDIAMKAFRSASASLLSGDATIDSVWNSKEIQDMMAALRKSFPPPPGWQWDKAWFVAHMLNHGVDFIDACIKSHIDASYNPTGMKSVTWDAQAGQAASGEAYKQDALVYADCRPVPPDIQALWTANKCTTQSDIIVNNFTSPISLLWSRDIDIKTIVSKTKFPLNPIENGKWFSWRGSGFTPLLVWDADGLHHITSASQLFGNHTWGKQWAHGYEALASLDKDNNRWLENSELNNIALWFDFNQDGISDKGEVRSLNAVGVTALGVSISRRDEKSGLIFADKGYRRTVKTAKGSTVHEGKSVDWFSSAVEGSFGHEALYQGDLEPQQYSPADSEPRAAAMSQHPSFALISQVSGLWEWTALDPEGNELPENLPSGSFTLFASPTGLQGTLINSERFGPNRGGIGEAFALNGFSGSIKRNQKGELELSFESKNARQANVQSVARLSHDGEYLLGATRESAQKDGVQYQYTWRARRLR